MKPLFPVPNPQILFPDMQAADDLPPGSMPERLADAARDMIASAVGTGDFWAKVVVTVGLLAGLWAMRRVVLRLVEPRVDDARSRYQWAKTTSYVTSAAGLLVVATLWLTGLRSIGTFLGLLTAGLAIALKDVVADVAAWLFIIFRRPFEVGDRVQIGSDAGDVVDLNLFQFTLLEIGNWVDADQSTGRVIHVPNALVFTQPLANFTSEFQYIWNEIPITFTFESDWRRARDILLEVATNEAGDHAAEAEIQLRRATRKFFIRYAHLTPAVYTEIRDSGVLLTLRYLCPARARRGTAARLQEAILDTLASEPTIQIAHPTTRIFRNNEEGKPALREGADVPGRSVWGTSHPTDPSAGKGI